MKTLYLLRHAKAEAGTKDVSDKDRHLTPRGHEACAAIGTYMKAKRYLPELALVSPSVRTRETLECVGNAAGALPTHCFEQALYLATAEEILDSVRSAKETLGSIMIIGHNPGMHHAALLFSQTQRTGPRTALELKYPTCALTVLQFDAASWKKIQPGSGNIADFITPEEL